MQKVELDATVCISAGCLVQLGAWGRFANNKPKCDLTCAAVVSDHYPVQMCAALFGASAVFGFAFTAFRHP